MHIGEAGPSREKVTTSAAKRKQHLETRAKEEPVCKKAKNVRGQHLSRDLVIKDEKPKQETVDMKVVCPMPRASEKKTLLMRKFVQEKCILNNEVGTHAVKWSPEIELSSYKDSAYEKKIFQAHFKLCMSNNRGDIDDDDYSFGEFPVNTTYSMRKGVEKKDNDTKLDMDHATFSMLVSEGRKLCHFVDRNLRGKTFNSEEEMNLPEMISLDTKETSNGNKIHILLILSIYKWGKRGGNKFQPFFNIRRFIEDSTDGKLAPTVKGLTLNFREMHNLVFSASEYLNVMVDQFAKPKLVHDKMKIVLGEKIKGFMKNNPDVNTEKLDFLLDSDNQHETESDDEEDFSDLQIESDLKAISDSDNDNEIRETTQSFDEISDSDFL
jgi:hypothetical protein